MYRCTLKVLYNACHSERYGEDSGGRTIAEWPRCLVDLMPGSVGAERVAIIASIAEREGATGKGESKEDRWAGFFDKR